MGVTLALQINATLVPGTRGLANILTTAVYVAQLTYLIVLFSVMGRGLNSALRKVIDCGVTIPKHEAGKTRQEPLVSDAMRRNMLRYRRGSIPIGIVAIIEAVVNMLVPDHGGKGRATAKYVLSALLPSILVALLNQLLLKTIPTTDLDRRAITSRSGLSQRSTLTGLMGEPSSLWTNPRSRHGSQVRVGAAAPSSSSSSSTTTTTSPPPTQPQSLSLRAAQGDLLEASASATGK
jgi:hypothetical protein